jgi:hypothetical protein
MDNPLEGVRWTHHDVAVFDGLDRTALKLFRDEVVNASIGALDRQIDALERSEDEAERSFGVDVYAELRQSTIEGFLLTTQSMHERGLRGLMFAMATRLRWEKADCSKLQKVLWALGEKRSVQSEFARLFEAPIQWFGRYDDLNLLWILASAIRHGDGASAQRLHEICPALWTQWLAPGSPLPGGRVVPDTAPAHPSFGRITLTRALLDQMIMTVQGFWEDIEYVRCNSFSRRHKSTDVFMDTLRAARRARDSERVWHWT